MLNPYESPRDNDSRVSQGGWRGTPALPLGLALLASLGSWAGLIDAVETSPLPIPPLSESQVGLLLRTPGHWACVIFGVIAACAFGTSVQRARRLWDFRILGVMGILALSVPCLYPALCLVYYAIIATVTGAGLLPS